jgi:hypothetical protein
MGRRLHAPSCLTRPPRSPGPGSAPRRCCAASRLAGTTTVERGVIARQRSNPESRDDSGLLRRCAPRNDGGETCVLILAPAFASECCSSDRPLENEGAGKAGCRSHPWPACSRKSRRQSPQVRAGSSGLPRAMVGTAYTCSPRGPAVLPPSPARSSRLATPAWSQHRETRTTRFRRAHRIVRRHDRSRCNPTRPPHPAPHARDDRDAPLK